MTPAPFTVASDGKQFSVIYRGNLRSTLAEAGRDAARRNREARARLVQAGLAPDERGHTTHESER